MTFASTDTLLGGSIVRVRFVLTLIAACMAVVALAPSASAAPRQRFTTHSVAFGRFHLHVRDYPGAGPAIVLMHGFPDNLHLYDRVYGDLRGRRVVAFDFLGFGQSDKPRGHDYTFAEQAAQLDAVVRALHLGGVVLVAHDASGPAAINWALDHRASVAGLVLLNTFYGAMPTTNPPEAIRIYSEPGFQDLAQAITADRRVSRWLYFWQVGRFISNPRIRSELVPKLWRQFIPAQPAFAALNRDLLPAVAADTRRTPELQAFDRPVRIIFGARDPYLNAGMAHSFHALFPTSDLFLLPARHYVQVDAPRRVARLIKTMGSPPG
jgi:haloalkane dehalogenase